MVQTQVKDLADNYEMVDDASGVGEILTKSKQFKGSDGEKVDTAKSINLKNGYVTSKDKDMEMTKP